jgi:hypothetical protein
MRQIAHIIDTKELRKMADKNRCLHDELVDISKKLIAEMAELNRSGFKDTKFDELMVRVEASGTDLKALQNFMIKYEDYLRQQEKNLSQYMQSPKLK